MFARLPAHSARTGSGDGTSVRPISHLRFTNVLIVSMPWSVVIRTYSACPLIRMHVLLEDIGNFFANDFLQHFINLVRSLGRFF